MRAIILSMLILGFINSRLTGQVADSIVSARPPKWENRTFMGKAGIATLEVLGMETFTTTILVILPRSITMWEDQYWMHLGRNFKRAYTMPPVWDQDPWAINYIGHPYQGSVFFNTLRSQNCSFQAAAGFTLFHTVLWEYGTEAFMERPSIQDLIVTPITGVAFGELFHFLTKKMRRGGFTTGEKILVTLINPSYVVNNGYR
jgi:hypothetical protein